MRLIERRSGVVTLGAALGAPDENGVRWMGNPNATCPHCGSGPMITASTDGSVAIYHLSDACKQKRCRR